MTTSRTTSANAVTRQTKFSRDKEVDGRASASTARRTQAKAKQAKTTGQAYAQPAALAGHVPSLFGSGIRGLAQSASSPLQRSLSGPFSHPPRDENSLNRKGESVEPRHPPLLGEDNNEESVSSRTGRRRGPISSFDSQWQAADQNILSAFKGRSLSTFTEDELRQIQQRTQTYFENLKSRIYTANKNEDLLFSVFKTRSTIKDAARLLKLNRLVSRQLQTLRGKADPLPEDQRTLGELTIGDVIDTGLSYREKYNWMVQQKQKYIEILRDPPKAMTQNDLDRIRSGLISISQSIQEYRGRPIYDFEPEEDLVLWMPE